MVDIKERIQKLLSLASSNNENEAKAALLKAKELMIKYKISEADVNEKQDELVHILCEDVVWTTDSGRVWMVDLCKIIAENYLCVAAWQSKKGCRTYTLVITGMSEDASICKEVLAYALGFIRNEVKILQHRHSQTDGKTVESSYVKGFIMGLQMAFEDQEEDHPEWGLVAVKPEEVENYTKELGTKNVKTKKAGFDPLAFMKGQVDGEKFNPQGVMGDAT